MQFITAVVIYSDQIHVSESPMILLLYNSSINKKVILSNLHLDTILTVSFCFSSELFLSSVEYLRVTLHAVAVFQSY